MKKGRKSNRGRYPIVHGEETKRATVSMGQTLYEYATARAGAQGLSAYIRELIEDDIRKAMRKIEKAS
jgi:hypothetical protein